MSLGYDMHLIRADANAVTANNANRLWLDLLGRLIDHGSLIKPRGLATRELSPMTLTLTNSLKNIVTVARRKLNYSFMVAEWFWIMSGSNDVDTLAYYNPNIAKFSDDGKVLAGAYGPPLVEQLPYVYQALKRDPATRQAVLTLWKPSPRPSKDIPCTVGMQFMLREGRIGNVELVANVFMRSSDAWLGLPYDLFTFTRIQAYLAGALGVSPGQLTILIGSSHLYESDIVKAKEVYQDYMFYEDETYCWSPRIGRPPLEPFSFGYAEAAARHNGEILLTVPEPYGDYLEALAYRHNRSAFNGGGHVMKLIREMSLQQSFIGKKKSTEE